MSLTIIGFGNVTSDDLGETGQEQQCVWCSTHVFYHLFLMRTWFTYYFIRLIPYHSEYQIVCPACGRGVRILGHEVKAAKRGELMLRGR